MRPCLRLPLFAATAVGIFLASAEAKAQATGFAVNRFEPSERGSEWFVGDSLDLRRTLRGPQLPVVGVIGDYGHRPLSIYGSDGSLKNSPVRHLVFAHLGASYALADRFRFALSLPLQAFAEGEEGRVGTTLYRPPPNSAGVGDLRIAADARIFGHYGGVVTGAVGVQLWFPTGDRDQYSSDGYFRVRPRAMVAGDIGMFTYAGQLNVAVRGRSESVSGGAIGSEIGFAASAGVRVVKGKLVVGPEIFGSTVFEDPFSKRGTPIEGLLGAHYLAGDFRFGAGVGTGLSRGFGAPDFRALLGIEWLPDYERRLPRVYYQPDGDTHPLRNCAERPGEHGCPGDRDHDGIPDPQDACPDLPGVASSGSLGCPPDTDGDGVNDLLDACPTVTGLKSDDPKHNGCPDPDRDKDGIPNADDACPDEPGPRDPDLERSGCPKAFLRKGAIQILDQVKFKTASAEIDKGKDSEEVLGAVLRVLTDHREIKRVRIEGYTDDRGDPAANKALSASRANSVVAWLVAHGIEKERLASEGFGAERPIDTNETEAGRRANRRVEFHIEP